VADVVCILTAGRGSRMGKYADLVNKALLPVGGKAVLSHIVARFAADAEFVVATGHLGEQVRTYFRLAHPGVSVRFVDLDRIDGAGAGPGYSLLACEPWLRRPFTFVACDTLWDGDLPSRNGASWVGTARVPAAEAARYCNFRIANGRVVSIHDKQAVAGNGCEAFVGLCHIHDHATFWAGLRAGDPVAGEHQISSGLRALLEDGGLGAVPVDWTDVGDLEHYRAVVRRQGGFDFSKTNEFAYLVGERVVKFFADGRIAERRVRRALANPGAFPAGVEGSGQFLAYRFQPGRTLYERNDEGIFRRLLAWLEADVWQPVEVPRETVAAACNRFYRDKTAERLARYFRKHAVADGPSVVNGVAVPPTAELLARVPWDRLADGRPVVFHGDLQFDNVIHDEATGRFTLLDWREDFGGQVEFGDLYYDLAKLWGGIVLNYDLVKRNCLSLVERDGTVHLDFAQRFTSPRLREILAEWICTRGLDSTKVRTLVGLIFLNMSPLHHEPFDRLLYSLGRMTLHHELCRAR
jgi:dTDP-glucose pyrophosphorylase